MLGVSFAGANDVTTSVRLCEALLYGVMGWIYGFTIFVAIGIEIPLLGYFKYGVVVGVFRVLADPEKLSRETIFITTPRLRRVGWLLDEIYVWPILMTCYFMDPMGLVMCPLAWVVRTTVEAFF
jgi:hypothetical protein